MLTVLYYIHVVRVELCLRNTLVGYYVFVGCTVHCEQRLKIDVSMGEKQCPRHIASGLLEFIALSPWRMHDAMQARPTREWRWLLTQTNR